jgi:GntR family transcriptional regulator/MocR family aminotransferase
VLEIAFRPDRASGVPLARQLADHVEALVRSGRLVRGSKLPASREAAVALGVSRKTVIAAYDQLAARGVTGSHVGQGTFVLADEASHRPVARGAAARTPREFAWGGLLAREPAATPAALHLRRSEQQENVAFDFRGGRVEASALPLADLRWAVAHPFRSRTRLRELAAHHDPAGWPPLRREIARMLVRRGLSCDPREIAVVNGVQHAIDLTARVLIEPGDAVVVEQPGYFGAALAFAARGADVLGVDVDAEGLRTDRLARVLRLRRVKLVYVTPATQSPTGVVMSPARREALLALADEHQVPIFEDDYDNELRYAGPVQPALKATDPAGQIVHAGTFSKVLFPGLRVGYLVAPRPLLRRVIAARAASDFGSGVIEQAALAGLLATRGLDRHLQRMRRLYASRMAAMLASLRREMPAGTRWTEPSSGHLVWLTLPTGVDPDRLHQGAFARGVAYTRGEVFFADGCGGEHLALAFAAVDEATIVKGIARLGRAMHEAASSGRAEGLRRPAARAVAARPTGRRRDGAQRAR